FGVYLDGGVLEEYLLIPVGYRRPGDNGGLIRSRSSRFGASGRGADWIHSCASGSRARIRSGWPCGKVPPCAAGRRGGRSKGAARSGRTAAAAISSDRNRRA